MFMRRFNLKLNTLTAGLSPLSGLLLLKGSSLKEIFP